ncbi:glycosyl transferase family 2 [Candidatus Woesearchaeota archaeon]|nr:MAG: glycosyl transferase family 2 [Candidatus Woesearchaeota archaeon]
MKINIVIPIAGRGSRFSKVGFELPKPLIDVKGKPMTYWAVKSFENLEKFDIDYVFVVLQEHVDNYNIDEEIKKILPGKKVTIISIPEVTRGQSETCLKAEKYIDNDERLIIYNGDTYSVSNLEPEINNDEIEGIIPCFQSEDPRYSYAKLNNKSYVEEVAEKKAISTNASSGLYYFRYGKDFVKAAKAAINNNITHNNEYYVGPLYNALIKEGKKIKICDIKSNWVLGTPEERDFFIKNFN